MDHMPIDLPQAHPLVDSGDWRGLPHDAAQVAMITGTLWGLLLALAAAVLIAVPLRIGLDLSWLQTLLAMLCFGLLLVTLCIWAGYRRWKFSAWRLDATGLHVRRGHLWRKEILIPRSRVQHLDIERGPIERHFKLATLIVHTAGTRLHALRQAGFDDADAIALRDALVPASDARDDVL